MDVVQSECAVQRLALPAVADLGYAQMLKSKLVDALEQEKGVLIDASEVQRITTPCFQILISATRTFADAGRALTFVSRSAAFTETANVLGLESFFREESDRG